MLKNVQVTSVFQNLRQKYKETNAFSEMELTEYIN